jgi:hypothetical protein
MSLTSSEIMEIAFDIFYLIFIWALDILMLTKRKKVEAANKRAADLILAAFLLLAIGDTGHVGFRVVAYALGGLEANVHLVGLGSLSTGITIGIVYMLFLEYWRIMFAKPRSAFYYVLNGVGILRLVIMAFPQNDWESTTPPYGWSLARNIPLMIQGLGLAIVMLQEANKTNNKVGRQLAWCIFTSYLFYTPVILFYHLWAPIGMLMMPKTVAYMVMAWIGYKSYFAKSGDATPVERIDRITAPPELLNQK